MSTSSNIASSSTDAPNEASTHDPTEQPDEQTEEQGAEPAAAACRNCGASLHGSYCHACGQPVRTLPLSARELVSDLLKNVFNLERGVLHTVVECARNPGRVARRYADGARKSFLSPLSYFLFVSTLAFVLYTVFQEAYIRHLMQGVELGLTANAQLGIPDQNPYGPDGLMQRVYGVESTRELAEWLYDLLIQAQTYLMLLFALPIAGVMHWFMKGRSYSETMVYVLYTLAQAILVLSVFGVVLAYTVPSALFVVGFLQVSIHVWTAPAFYGGAWSTRGRAMLAHTIGYGTAVLGSMLLGGLIGFVTAVLQASGG